VIGDFPGPWGVGGGWAIDLFIGRKTRPHANVDIAILRDHRSKSPDAKDDHDLLAASGHLSAEQRMWLIESFRVTAPAHPWIAVLSVDR
jgi:hypothetical protein